MKRTIAGATLGLAIAGAAFAQAPQPGQRPDLMQRGQQLLQGLSGGNQDQAARDAYERGRADEARRREVDRDRASRGADPRSDGRREDAYDRRGNGYDRGGDYRGGNSRSGNRNGGESDAYRDGRRSVDPSYGRPGDGSYAR